MTAQEVDQRIALLQAKQYSVISEEDLVARRNIIEQRELDLRDLQVDLTLQREIALKI